LGSEENYFWKTAKERKEDPELGWNQTNYWKSIRQLP
jgi:hypothetical protein